MPSDYSNPIFHDADKARVWLEARLWADGPVCPKCGTIGEATLMKGKTTRPGLYQCNACRAPFTVTLGTIYERSHVPLNKWLGATYLMMASKKGMSALQISRMIGVTYKTAWFMCHRIRESLRDGHPGPLGGAGMVVEADETYVGGREANRSVGKRRVQSGATFKEPVVALVERGGRVRSQHVRDANSKTLRPILTEQIHADTHLMTDTARMYPAIGGKFAQHSMVNHTLNEYVRGVTGAYHHVSPQHLKRYVCEFDFRYNERSALGVTDAMRFDRAILGIVGRRLTYRRIGEGSEAAQAWV